MPTAALDGAMAAMAVQTPRANRGGREPAATPGTQTKRGAAALEDVLSGRVRKFAFDVRDLPLGFDEARDALVAHARAVLAAVERTRPVARFMVGKTSMAKAGSVPEERLDTRNLAHLQVAHIADRWRKLYEPHGYDGLVVLTLVAARTVPAPFLRLGFSVQDYALSMEKHLIEHFALREVDERLANRSLASGQLERSGAPVYVVYLAFKCREEEDTENVPPQPALLSSPVLPPPLAASHVPRPSLAASPAPPPRKLDASPQAPALAAAAHAVGLGTEDVPRATAASPVPLRALEATQPTLTPAVATAVARQNTDVPAVSPLPPPRMVAATPPPLTPAVSAEPAPAEPLDLAALATELHQLLDGMIGSDSDADASFHDALGD